MTRLELVTEIPAPYRIPLFNALAERLDLHVLFLRERNPDRPFDLHREELDFDLEQALAQVSRAGSTGRGA